MAIDTRNKRGSAIGFGQAHGVVLPNPDGAALSAADRQQVALSYASGDAGGGGGPGAGGGLARGRLAERWIGRRGRAIK